MPPFPSLPALQQLPPSLAHLCLRVERFITSTLQVDLRHRKILVACSGGPDSMALLATLHALTVRGEFSLVVGHLDHGLREGSLEDAAVVGQLCDSLVIPCVSERMDVAVMASLQKIGLEEAGRLARLAFLEDVRAQYDADWIATGHQLDDLAEDQLMRQLRGTGWPALGGMTACDRTNKLLRPLLLTPKADLLELAHALRLPYRNDPMNEDPRFLRNRIRHTILPLLLQENPSYLDQVAGLWNMARWDDSHFDLAITACLEQAAPIAGGLRLPMAALEGLDTALRLRCCKKVLETLNAGPPQMDTLFKLEEAIAGKRTGAAFCFPGGVTATVRRDGVAFAIQST